MKTISLVPKLIEDFNFDATEKQIAWICALPKTKRGKAPYRFVEAKAAIYFVRSEDATAFRLRFGL